MAPAHRNQPEDTARQGLKLVPGTPGQVEALARRDEAGQGDSAPDWSALMVCAQAGDQQAYLTLLRAITPYLRGLARRGGIGSDEVEDAVQDILLTLHAVRHTYDPTRPFGPWLVAVARHRLVDRVRRRQRLWGRETELTAAHETFAAEETNFHETASKIRRLRAALALLPAGQRQAIELLRLQELSLKEASARSGLKVSALKVAVHRAVKRLRSLLGED